MAKRRKRDRHPTKTRADQEGTDIHSQTSSSRQEKWISISGGWISLIAVHRPLSGPGVNIAGWCQDANTDQSRGDGPWWALMGPDGSWWPSNLPKLWWLLCRYNRSKFYHCHSLFLSRSTQSVGTCVQCAFSSCPWLTRYDGIVFCVLYCSLNSYEAVALKKAEESE